MRAVVSYDITKDRSRTRVAKVFEGVLERVQYSVFEGEVPENALSEAVEAALGYVDPETDSLRIYRICNSCVGRINAYGRSTNVAPGPVRVI